MGVESLAKTLDWKLLRGSHEFPGPKGGTCINEAAIVAAGFAYMEVAGVDDMPPCFCRVISQFALTLNDKMPDDQRQRLISFVARLAGTADTPEIQAKRAHFIIKSAINVLVADMMQSIDPAIAMRCRAAVNLEDIAHRAALARDKAHSLFPSGHLQRTEELWSVKSAANCVAISAFFALARADVKAAGATAEAAENAALHSPAKAWDWAIKTLDEVLQIGNRADDVDAALVMARLDAARGLKQPVKA